MIQLPNKKYRASYEIFLELNNFVFPTPNFLIGFYGKYGFVYPSKSTLDRWIKANKKTKRSRRDNTLKLIEKVDNLIV